MSDTSKYMAAMRAAIKIAKHSDHYQHKVGCVLMRGGTIISSAANSGYMHSEHRAINVAWRSDVTGATAVVVRIRRNGTIGLSKPCKLCAARLAQAGIKRVVYSTQQGTLEVLKLDQQEEQYLQYHFIGPNHQHKAVK